MIDLLKEIFPWISPVIAAFAGWAFGRRKQIAEAESGELDNVEKGLSIYRNIINDLVSGQNELKERVKNISAENEGLHKENRTLKKRVEELEREIKKLKPQND